MEFWQLISSHGFVGVWALTVELGRWLFTSWSFDSQTRAMTLYKLELWQSNSGDECCTSWSFDSQIRAMTLYELEIWQSNSGDDFVRVGALTVELGQWLCTSWKLWQSNSSNDFRRALERYQEQDELEWNSLHTTQIRSVDLVKLNDDFLVVGAFDNWTQAMTLELECWQLNSSDGFVGVWALTVELGRWLCMSWSFDSRTRAMTLYKPWKDIKKRIWIRMEL